MMSAFTEIFHDELAEATNKGFNAGRLGFRDALIAGGMKPNELQDRLIAGGMNPSEAANFAGLTG